VLVVARMSMAVGFGYNRFTARNAGRVLARADNATALAELTDLRDRRLISIEEFDAKRSKVIDRL
jgi:hypothetical protein